MCVLKKGLIGIFCLFDRCTIRNDYILYSIQRDLRINIERPNKNVIDKRMIKYSLQLMPNSISWWITSYADRFHDKMFLGMSMNGILCDCGKISFCIEYDHIYIFYIVHGRNRQS